MFIGLSDENLPAVTGHDAAGEVCVLGDGVQGWSVGDKVYVVYLLVGLSDIASSRVYTLVASISATESATTLPFRSIRSPRPRSLRVSHQTLL